MYVVYASVSHVTAHNYACVDTTITLHTDIQMSTRITSFRIVDGVEKETGAQGQTNFERWRNAKTPYNVRTALVPSGKSEL